MSLGAGGRRGLGGVVSRMVDAEMDHARARRVDELLGQRVVAGVGGEEQHLVGRAPGRDG